MKKYNNYLTLIALSVTLICAQDNTMPEMSDEYLNNRETAINPTHEIRNTIIVDQFGGGDYTTIQDAIDATDEGDAIIQVNAGEYYENVYIHQYTGHRELRGAGMGATIMKALCSPMYIYTNGNNSSFIISGFTFTTINNSCADYLLSTYSYEGSNMIVEHCEFPQDANEVPYYVHGHTNASIVIRNNVFKEQGETAIYIQEGISLYAYNNVFDRTGTAIYWNTGGYGVIEICNNMFFNSGTISLQSSGWQHWNRYNASTGGVSHDYFPLENIDPMFFDPDNGDYRISDDSPLIDAGAPDEIYVDLDGSRNNISVYGGPYTWRSLGPIITNFQVTPDVVPQGETIRIQASGSAE